MGGKGNGGGGERGIIYLSLQYHYQKDSCTKMGSNESHFNVSLIVRDKVTRQCPQTTTFFLEKGEPKRNRALALLSAYQPNALPLGQTGTEANHVSLVSLTHQPHFCDGFSPFLFDSFFGYRTHIFL